MKILCAWCEEEGKKALIRENQSDPSDRATHGICRAHEVALLKQIAALARKHKEQARQPVLCGRELGTEAQTMCHTKPREFTLPRS